MRRRLCIMVKEPHPGRVKTRLGAGIGQVAAAWWFRHQTRALIRRLARDRRWQVVLMVSPDAEGLLSRVWPKEVRRQGQGRGDLGARMLRAFGQAPAGPVVIVGADIPGITAEDIAAAFRALGRADAVFGPAPDGGYWLVGLKHPRRAPPGFMREVRWSTPFALEDTVASLGPARVARLRELRDVDTAEDLGAL